MTTIQISEEIFRRNKKECFESFHGFAQNVEALASLISQATGSICTIATTPFSPDERKRFLSMLHKDGWSAEISPRILRINGTTYGYDAYVVRNPRNKQAVNA